MWRSRLSRAAIRVRNGPATRRRTSRTRRRACPRTHRASTGTATSRPLLSNNPYLLAQLSDPHVRAASDDGIAARQLSAAVNALLEFDPLPGAVLLTGDLAEHGGPVEYALVRELLEPLPMPVYVLPGNHDGRAALREAFELPGSGDEPVRYTVQCGPLRVVVCDTTVPGRDEGRLGPEALAWLDGELGVDGVTPTIVAMHQPPLFTGVPPMDAICLPPDDCAGLAEIFGRHPTVQRVVCGHVHGAMYSVLGGVGVFTAPSTYLQMELDFQADDIRLSSNPPGYALHVWAGDSLTTHVQPVAHGATQPHRR
jgi:3',5'-cyclic-AMP phosphodiesterase